MNNKSIKKGVVVSTALLVLLVSLGLSGCKSDKSPSSETSGVSGSSSTLDGTDPSTGDTTIGETDSTGTSDTTKIGLGAGGNSTTNRPGGSAVIPPAPETDKIIDKAWYQGTDISKNPFFNPDNVAPAINDTVKKMKVGDKAYLAYGQYKYSNTIEIVNTANNLKNCVIVLDGVYSQPKTSTFDAMKVEGDYLTLKVNKITNYYISNTYPTKRANGITFSQSQNCNYDFGQVVGFEYGLRFMPSKSGRSIENNIVNFRYLGDCKYPIYMETAAGVNASVNKNTFTGGRVKGYTGLTMKKGSAQNTPHTANQFVTVSWESIETTGIDAQYSSACTFFAPRFESVIGINILEGSESSGNRYDNSVDLPLNKIQLSSKDTVINMPVYRVDPYSEWQDVIKIMKTDSSGRVSYEFFEESFVKVVGGTEVLGLNCTNVVVNAQSSAVNLKLHSMAAFNGAEIWIYVNDAAKGVSITGSDGNTIISTSQLTKGTYRLTYTTSWKLNKVSGNSLL